LYVFVFVLNFICKKIQCLTLFLSVVVMLPLGISPLSILQSSKESKKDVWVIYVKLSIGTGLLLV
jgi:hypothetical protein